MLGVVARVFAITIVPLSIGMWFALAKPRARDRAEPKAKRIAAIVFVGVVIGAVVNEFETVTDNFTELALATLTLNVVAMAISFTIARLARLDERQSTAIAMELGIHNAALAIAVGARSPTFCHPGRGLQLADVLHGGSLCPRDVPPQRRAEAQPEPALSLSG